MIKLEEIDFSDINEIYSTTSFWGSTDVYTLITITLENGEDGGISSVEEHLELINSNLLWIEENRNIVEKSLIQQNASNLAKIWTQDAGLDLTIEDDSEYAEINGVKFPFPVTDKDFLQSLIPTGISLEVEENIINGEKKAECYILIFFECIPDYFKGNSLEVEISEKDGEKLIELHGIVG